MARLIGRKKREVGKVGESTWGGGVRAKLSDHRVLLVLGEEAVLTG